MKDKKRIVVIGAGNMGTTHAKALENNEGSEVVALVSRGDSKRVLQKTLGRAIPLYSDWREAIDTQKPDAVVIASTTATHAPIAKYALKNGMHVFCEKPIAETGPEGRRLQALAQEHHRILNIGYILEYSIGYHALVKHARSFDGPYDIFMTLNQRSSGKNWETHKKLIAEAGSPVVVCAPHYISIAGQIIDAAPVRVYGSGRRMHPDTTEGTFDSAMIEISYADGSRFEYRAAWGPFVSPEGFSTKTVNTPYGFVQLEREDPNDVPASDLVEAHVNVERIRVGNATLGLDGTLAHEDKIYDFKSKNEHDDLGAKQMQYFLDAMAGKVDTEAHLERAVRSTELALMGHQSALEHKVITL
ncbi:MAG TPA: Gfo/Idh/MocA family oxidoreductase [Flavobacteriaceae bacterium]|nr:Gfo/Idh/MocA family oxidoreductase [Flavobacteriaceae bacterium]